MLINVEMPTSVGILTFMSMLNFLLSCVEHEISFIISWPDRRNPSNFDLTHDLTVHMTLLELRHRQRHPTLKSVHTNLKRVDIQVGWLVYRYNNITTYGKDFVLVFFISLLTNTLYETYSEYMFVY